MFLYMYSFIAEIWLLIMARFTFPIKDPIMVSRKRVVLLVLCTEMSHYYISFGTPQLHFYFLYWGLDHSNGPQKFNEKKIS